MARALKNGTRKTYRHDVLMWSPSPVGWRIDRGVNRRGCIDASECTLPESTLAGCRNRCPQRHGGAVDSLDGASAKGAGVVKALQLGSEYEASPDADRDHARRRDGTSEPGVALPHCRTSVGGLADEFSMRYGLQRSPCWPCSHPGRPAPASARAPPTSAAIHPRPVLGELPIHKTTPGAWQAHVAINHVSAPSWRSPMRAHARDSEGGH